MSLRESELVAAQTVLSNGAGASVGLEAGYAQIGAGIASSLGVMSHLRRQDLRMLVGCGAGGAIAAAFGAPLTGAFYAFELIIGAYSLANVVPVFAATLVAVLTTKAIIGAPYVISAPEVSPLNSVHYVALVGLGLVAAALGVGAMRAAALIERAFPHPRTFADISPRRRRNDARRHGALHAPGARRRPWRAGARFLLAADRDGAHRPHRTEAHRESGVAGLRLPRRLVLRLAVRRLAPRQALFDRHRLSIPVSRPRHDRLRSRRHGDPEHCDRRRAR